MESISQLEERHDREIIELRESIKKMLKGAKKNTRAQLEAQAIQMEFDLKARHRDELEELEGKADNTSCVIAEDSNSNRDVPKLTEDEEVALLKRAKAKKKQDKRAAKEREKEDRKQQILVDTIKTPSHRDIELADIVKQIDKIGFIIKDIPSDGNCLYRALADQLLLTNDTGNPTPDFKELRKIAAMHIERNAEDYAPFLGLTPSEVSDYCRKISSDTLAEWGGQVELKALSESLQREIHIYAANSPVVRMGCHDGAKPLRLAFHRHYFALGEHYNSIIPLQQSCGCDC